MFLINLTAVFRNLRFRFQMIRISNDSNGLDFDALFAMNSAIIKLLESFCSTCQVAPYNQELKMKKVNFFDFGGLLLFFLFQKLHRKGILLTVVISNLLVSCR